MDPLQQEFDDAELLAWIDDDGEWGGNIYYPPQVEDESDSLSLVHTVLMATGSLLVI